MKAKFFVCGVTLLVAVWPMPHAFSIGVIDEDPIVRESHIETGVIPNGNGTFTYNYRVVNDSKAPQLAFVEVQVWPSIIGYEIPLDDPSVVWDVLSPDTWNHRFLSAADYEFEYGSPNPFNSFYVLQWYDINPPVNKMIVPDGFNQWFEANEYEPFADGFSMTSNLGPVDGPYAALWFDRIRQIGDPPLPGGAPIGAGALPYRLVPEVPAQGLAALGCLGFACLTWLRRRV